MKKDIGLDYFDILLKNSDKELEEFINQNGIIKPECPIMFINDTELNLDKEN